MGAGGRPVAAGHIPLPVEASPWKMTLELGSPEIQLVGELDLATRLIFNCRGESLHLVRFDSPDVAGDAVPHVLIFATDGGAPRRLPATLHQLAPGMVSYRLDEPFWDVLSAVAKAAVEVRLEVEGPSVGTAPLGWIVDAAGAPAEAVSFRQLCLVRQVDLLNERLGIKEPRP